MRTDFERILVESLDEAITFTLAKGPSPDLERHLRNFLALPYDRMNAVELLFSSLERAYGLLGADVLRLVVRKMYAKADVPFYEVAGTPMFQYVYDLKEKLANYDSYGKPPRRENQRKVLIPKIAQLVPTKLHTRNSATSGRHDFPHALTDNF